ncbi:MAG: protein kinase, partial [bacterium]|nr:protein kinase [bacterium]
MGSGESTEPGHGEKIGHYRIEGRLGKGGMGEVYRAYDDQLDRPVALKRIKPDSREPENARKRFRREARVVARLSHPAIVQVHDWVETDDGDWIVMELVEGRLVRELLADGPLPPADAVAIAHDLAAGLAVAHQAGLVHRDLKPENVMITPAGEVKILDFGLAKRFREEDPEATQLSRDGQMLGTVTAMSPEQVLGRPVDHRSDLFALGTLLYELLTGVPPFKGGNAAETVTRVCARRQAPACEVNPAVPKQLSALVDHLLDKEPTRRPQTTREVVAFLEKLAAALSAGSEITGVTLSLSSAGAVVRTLMLSDLVDSTRLVEQLGDERAAEVFHHHDRLARDLLKQHEGREIDKSDGFLLLFERPLSAVLYALAYHAALPELEREQGVELKSRVGIHVGEVVVRSNTPEDVASGAKPLEVEGLTKAMAARLMSAASAGQTLISRGVFDMGRRSAVGSDSVPEAVRWVDHGRYLMKGVDEPVRVFEVGIEGEAPLALPADSEKVRRLEEDAVRSPFRALAVAARSRWLRWAAAGLAAGGLVLGGWWWAARDRAARDTGPPVTIGTAQPVPSTPQMPAAVSMAVLSFRNLTGDPQFDWLCNGLTELLVTDLAQSSEVRILSTTQLDQILEAPDAIGPTLSFEQIRAIGEQGDVGAVVRGSFARVGEVLSVNITIEDTANGTILKSDRFEGHGEESLFAAVDELSAAIRNHFEVDRPAESPATVKMVTTSSPEAWRYYSDGLALFRQSKLDEAVLLLEQAVEIDPSFALALLDLGL